MTNLAAFLTKAGWRLPVFTTRLGVAFVLAICQAAQAASTVTDERYMAGIPASQVLAFYEGFRNDLLLGRRAEVCKDVEYPLSQLPDPVSSAAECVDRFPSIFTPDVVEAVRKTSFEDLASSSAGIWLRYGTIWFNGICRDKSCKESDIKVWSVSSAAQMEARRHPPKDHAFLTCITDDRRLQVSSDGKGGFQLRSWKRTEAITEPPSLELTGDAETIEGTGPCAAKSWHFRTGRTNVTLSELGCVPEDSPAPKGTIAFLTIGMENLPAATAWCLSSE